MNHRISLRLVGAILAPAVLMAFLIGVVIAHVFNLLPGTAGAQGNNLAQAGAGLAPGDHSPFVAVADSVLPAVVNISVERTVRVARRGGSSEPGSPLDELFREFFRGFPEAPAERTQNSLGSGVVISPDGYIVTNNHVVAGYDKVVVRMFDETEFSAGEVRVVGRDPKTDLAVLKVTSAKKLPAVKLANPDDIRVGDWAIAVGNPFGLSGTVTVGVVSAKGRSGLPMPEGPSYQDFIQTDASINPGNSGGALVNIRGELMGINSAIRSPVGVNVGIGFAVPVNLVKSITDQLIQTGKVVRGYMGIRPQPVTEAIRKAMNLADTRGVLVSDVVEGAPAERAGLRAGDVITAVNGSKTEGVEQFRRFIADFAPGSTVTLSLVRDGTKLTRTAKLVEFPDDQASVEPAGDDEVPEWLGLSVRRLSADEIETSGVRLGVVVERVEAASAAARAGIQRGDIILEVAGRRIEGPADYSGIARRLATTSKPVLFRLKRGDSRLFVAVEPGE